MTGWQGISFLDVLRPEPGERLRYAYLATYSLDLVALGAAVVAAAGLGDEDGKGTRIDFATAIEEVRGKLVVMAQRGRVAATSEKLAVLSILDQFVVEQAHDERRDSWHPKIAYVCHENMESESVRHTLWVGSRNLTRSRNWEVGLVLTSDPAGDPVQGLPDLVFELADRGHLEAASPANLRVEAQSLRWRSPQRMSVESIRLYPSGSGERWPEPQNFDRVVVVSPFVDVSTLNRVAAWPAESRTLLSTLPTLLALSVEALAPFDCCYLDEPDFDDIEPADTPSSDDEQLAIGLHAKLIAGVNAAGMRMWTGSANATHRGWQGRNAEVIAELRTDGSWVEGLDAIIGRARVFRRPEFEEPPADEAVERLEAFRVEVAARWDVRQTWSNGVSELRRQSEFHPDDNDIAMYVMLVGVPRPVLWSSGDASVQIQPVSAARVTELVLVRAELGAQRVQWVMTAPLDERPGVERDRRAIAELLDVRAFLSWIRSLLEAGVDVQVDVPWDEPMPKVVAGRSSGLNLAMPSLEDMLRTWAGRPERLAFVDERLKYYSQYMLDMSQEWSPEDRAMFEEFVGVWNTVAEVLR